MRDVNIRKDNDWIPKLIAGIVLGGGAFIVLIALVVTGFVVWKSQSPPPPTPNPPSPSEPFAAPQPPTIILPDDLQSLPALPAIKGEAVPVPPHAKRMDIVAVRSFAGHEGAVLSVALSPDEQRLISGGNDKTVRLWNLDNGEELARLAARAWLFPFLPTVTPLGDAAPVEDWSDLRDDE